MGKKNGLISMLTFHLFQDFAMEYDSYLIAKNYFDLKEYDRAAHFISSCTSPQVYFLYMYSRYLSAQKKKLDDSADAHGQFLDTLIHPYAVPNINAPRPICPTHTQGVKLHTIFGLPTGNNPPKLAFPSIYRLSS